MKKPQQKKLFLLIIILLFLGQFFFISPWGEFALNDDWVHTDTVKHWTDTGEFRLMPYAGPSFYVPIIYGAGLVKIFGFSFSLLRISTLVIALFLLILFYNLLSKISHRPALAFLGVLCLWLNPIFYNLSFTFMTDIPALFFLLISIWFYYQGFEKDNNYQLFWGSIFAVIGFFTRQTNILIMLSSGLFTLFQYKNFGFRKLLVSFGLPLIFAGTIYAFLAVFQLLPQNTFSHTIAGTSRLLGHIKWWLWYTPMYLGLFLLPLSGAWLIKNKQIFKNKFTWFLLSGIIILAIIIRQIFHLQFPYIGNIISFYGLGPMSGVIAGRLSPLMPGWVWGILTLSSAVGFFLLLSLCWDKTKLSPKNISFIYWFGFLYFIPILLFESFDRYFLPLLLILIIFISQKIKDNSFSFLLALFLITVSGFYSLSQTNHYLQWNSARWQLADSVLNEKTTTEQIDGGYEWDGWHSYWSAVDSGLEIGPKTAPWWIKNLFVNNTEDYIVSFSPFNDYEIITTKTLSGFNPNKTLYLLKKLQPIDQPTE